MKSFRMRTKIYAAISVLIVGVVSLVMYFQYAQQKADLLMGVDSRLLSASQLYRQVLGTDYHDSIRNKWSISKEKFEWIVAKNDSLCRELGYEYLWSLLEVDGQYYFTTATHKDKSNPASPVASFYQPHYKPDIFRKAFSTMKPDYRYIFSKWGQTRAIIFPYRDIHERKYIVAASIQIKNIEQLLNETVIRGIIIVVVIILCSWLFMYLLLLTLTRPLSILVESVENMIRGDYDSGIKGTGSREIRVLAIAFNNLRESVKLQLKMLKEKEDNIKQTLNSISDGVIAVDIEGLITRMNPVAEKLTGWSEMDSRGKEITTILSISEKDSKKIILPVKNIISMQESFKYPKNILLKSRTGVLRDIEFSASLIINSAGDIYGVVIVFRDITEKRQLEDQLMQSQKMEVVGQLAGGVAHDFNNMLGGIIGAADLLDAKTDQPELKKYINIILNASEKAGGLIRKLLDFSRKGKHVSTPVDLQAIVMDAVAILERSVDKNIIIKLGFINGSSWIVGDPMQLQNLFINLGINARDAMPKGGTLQFTLSNGKDTNDNDIIIVKVSDTGTGIKAEILEDIFNPFFTTKEQGKGTGLGLASAYGTIKSHSGEISVTSKIGVGTEFTLLFPASSSVEPMTE